MLALLLMGTLAAILLLPAPAFARRPSVALRPSRSALSVTRGHAARFSVHLNATGGARRLVLLSVHGLPAHVRTSMRPQRVRAGRTSTVTVWTSRATPLGAYSLQLIAAPASLRFHTASESRSPHRSSILAVRRLTLDIRAARSTGRSASTPPPAASEARAGSIPLHVPTWAYDDGCNGGSGASAGLVQRWVTFAESNCGPTARKALSDCHQGASCTPVQYMDANWIYAAGSLPVAAVAQESWWQHQPGYSDAAHRIRVSSYGGGNVLNQGNPAVRQWFGNYARTNYNSYPALMMDDSSASIASELWGSGYSTSQELGSNAQLQAAHEEMARELTHADGQPFLQIDNSLSTNPWLPTPFAMMGNPSSVEGAITEGAPMDAGTLTPNYSTLLDELAYVDHTAHDFAVMLSYDTSGATRSRLVQAATELLGYDENHVVSWSDLEKDSGNLAVWPEQGIVPTQPVQSMGQPAGNGCLAGSGEICSSGGHNSLEVAPGVYRREFATCYDQGAAFGDCAALVNTTGQAVTVARSWLRQTYGHQVTFSGGDVESGGTVDLTGTPFSPGSTTIPAQSAILVSH